MHCPHCGARLLLKGGFCRKCGRRIGIETKAPEKNSTATVLLIMLIMGLLIGFIFFAAVGYRKAVPRF